MHPDACNALVIGRQDLAAGLMIMQVAPDGWKLPPFSPGQYAVLGLPVSAPRTSVADREEPTTDDRQQLLRRPYSISSASRQQDYLEFYITLVYSGRLTPRLFALQPGDRLWLRPNLAGVFTIEDIPHNRHLLLMGTGTGLAPYMSMVRSRLSQERERHITIVHGARHSWDLGYRSELQAMAEICDHFTYLPAISRPESEHIPWLGSTGRIQDVWHQNRIGQAQGFPPDPGHSDVLLCGNPLMVTDMIAVCQQQGWTLHSRREPGNLHAETYW